MKNQKSFEPVVFLLLVAAGVAARLYFRDIPNFAPVAAIALFSGCFFRSRWTALCVPLSRRLVAGIGLIVLTALVAGVAQAPHNPYFALSLQAWEQGRFVRFHGLAQWIGWLWPFAAMASLLSRLAVRD